MANILLERDFEFPITLADIREMGVEASDCQRIFRVNWLESFLASDGRRLYCHFEAPDTEAVRQVMHSIRSDYKAIWPCVRLNSADTDSTINVLVERHIPEGTDPITVAELESRQAYSHPQWGLRYVRALHDIEGKRMLSLYEAPNARFVEQCHGDGGIAFESIWSCRHLVPTGSN